jgi:hypothetical protein
MIKCECGCTTEISIESYGQLAQMSMSKRERALSTVLSVYLGPNDIIVLVRELRKAYLSFLENDDES